jgi:hypothetical protein
MSKMPGLVLLLALLAQLLFISVVAQTVDAMGSASVRIDGQSFTYRLLTGFDVDTDFNNPGRSVVVFAISDWTGSTNPRRVRLIIDATRTGTFSTQDDGVYFKFIEDGGQHFNPRDKCEVEITSAYSGTAQSLYSGRISDCLVNSLASERNVSLEFTMKGVPKRF